MEDFKKYWNKLTLKSKMRFTLVVFPALIFMCLDIGSGKLALFFEAINEWFQNFSRNFVKKEK